MLKKVITYTDFDGDQKTEELLFNLTKAEIITMENGISGGMSEMLKRIVAEKDMKRLIEHFRDLLASAYGKRTPDGKFYKSKEISDEFISSEAYSELFMELISNENAAANFIKALMPHGIPT